MSSVPSGDGVGQGSTREMMCRSTEASHGVAQLRRPQGRESLDRGAVEEGSSDV